MSQGILGQSRKSQAWNTEGNLKYHIQVIFINTAFVPYQYCLWSAAAAGRAGFWDWTDGMNLTFKTLSGASPGAEQPHSKGHFPASNYAGWPPEVPVLFPLVVLLDPAERSYFIHNARVLSILCMGRRGWELGKEKWKQKEYVQRLIAKLIFLKTMPVIWSLRTLLFLAAFRILWSPHTSEHHGPLRTEQSRCLQSCIKSF